MNPKPNPLNGGTETNLTGEASRKTPNGKESPNSANFLKRPPEKG